MRSAVVCALSWRSLPGVAVAYLTAHHFLFLYCTRPSLAVTRIKLRFDRPGRFVWQSLLDEEALRPFYVGKVPAHEKESAAVAAKKTRRNPVDNIESSEEKSEEHERNNDKGLPEKGKHTHTKTHHHQHQHHHGDQRRLLRGPMV